MKFMHYSHMKKSGGGCVCKYSSLFFLCSSEKLLLLSVTLSAFLHSFVLNAFAPSRFYYYGRYMDHFSKWCNL